MSDARDERDDDAADLGTAAHILFEEGKVAAASLLLDARIRDRAYVDTGFPLDGSERGVDLFDVVLEVPRSLLHRFDDDVIGDIHGALSEVMRGDNVGILRVDVRAAITAAQSDWRETLRARLSPRVTNQARVGPPMTNPLMEDGCAFRSGEELRVYRAFKRARDRLSDDDSIAIAPNPALVVQYARTSEPDLLIMYRGHAGIVQVDGPHHRGRFAAEVSRDRIYRHSGIREIDHFIVEDTHNDADLDILVSRFLRRLADG